MERQTVKATTRETYANSLKNYLYPGLGDVAIRDIKPSTVKTWIGSLVTRGLSPNTVAQSKRVLSMVLESAVADGVLARNSARDKTARAPTVPPSPVQVWSIETVGSVADALPTRWREVPILGVGTGLRPGELFGLAVEDIDFLRGEITLARQIVIVGGKLCFSAPKYNSARTIPVTSDVTEALARHLARYPAALVELPFDQPDGDRQSHRLIFSTRERGAVNRNYLSAQIWRPALKSAGLPQTRVNGMHVLRHTYASLLLANGVGVVEVAAWLGHKDTAFTYRRYAHLLPSSPERTRSALNAAFSAFKVSDPGTETESILH